MKRETIEALDRFCKEVYATVREIADQLPNPPVTALLNDELADLGIALSKEESATEADGNPDA